MMKQEKKQSVVYEVEAVYKPAFDVDELFQITRSEHAEEFLRKIWADDMMHKERFYIVLLNNSMKVLGYSLISIGGLTGTVVDIQHIMQLAILSNAKNIIIAHNHPSGALYPSEPDRAITIKMKRACEIFNIDLADSFILTQKGYYSFADSGDI